MSDCVVEAYLGIAALKSEKAFSAWIFQILHRCCCAILSRPKDMALEDDGSLVHHDSHLAPELKEALAILSDEDRDIVLLHVVAGYKTREIATLLALNHATVRSRLSRALAKMREFLE